MLSVIDLQLEKILRVSTAWRFFVIVYPSVRWYSRGTEDE